MTRILHHKLSMYKVVHKVCSINISVWEDLDIFSITFRSFEQELNLLSNNALLHIAKNDLEIHKKTMNRLIEKLITLCKVHMQICSTKTDSVIYNFCPMKFAAGSTEEQLSKSIELYHHIYLFQKKHEFTAVKDSMLQFKKSIKKFELLVEKNNEEYKAPLSKIPTKTFDKYERLDKILAENLDNLMIYFKMREPSFYAMYFQARSVAYYYRKEGMRA